MSCFCLAGLGREPWGQGPYGPGNPGARGPGPSLGPGPRAIFGSLAWSLAPRLVLDPYLQGRSMTSGAK